MLLRVIFWACFVLVMASHEPDIDLGRPAPSVEVLSQMHFAMMPYQLHR